MVTILTKNLLKFYFYALRNIEILVKPSVLVLFLVLKFLYKILFNKSFIFFFLSRSKKTPQIITGIFFLQENSLLNYILNFPFALLTIFFLGLNAYFYYCSMSQKSSFIQKLILYLLTKTYITKENLFLKIYLYFFTKVSMGFFKVFLTTTLGIIILNSLLRIEYYNKIILNSTLIVSDFALKIGLILGILNFFLRLSVNLGNIIHTSILKMNPETPPDLDSSQLEVPRSGPTDYTLPNQKPINGEVYSRNTINDIHKAAADLDYKKRLLFYSKGTFVVTTIGVILGGIFGFLNYKNQPNITINTQLNTKNGILTHQVENTESQLNIVKQELNNTKSALAKADEENAQLKQQLNAQNASKNSKSIFPWFKKD